MQYWVLYRESDGATGELFHSTKEGVTKIFPWGSGPCGSDLPKMLVYKTEINLSASNMSNNHGFKCITLEEYTKIKNQE